jgi:hypothetical protein
VSSRTPTSGLPQSRPCRLHASNTCLWQVTCVVSKSSLWLGSMSHLANTAACLPGVSGVGGSEANSFRSTVPAYTSQRDQVIVRIAVCHINAKRGIPHHMNMQCRRKKQGRKIACQARGRSVHGSTDCRAAQLGRSRFPYSHSGRL